MAEQSVKETPETQGNQQAKEQNQQSKQKTVKLIIKRQDNNESKPYEETFEIPYKENLNVIACLMEIRRNPVNAKGEKTTPVTWDMNCLEEVCGACSMVINGRARQSCSAIVDQLEQPIRLEPMSTFPVIRDLQVDRSRMFDNLKRMKAWIPIDGQLWNMLVLARVITIGAYNRNESRGAHYKPEFPDRNDDEWLKTTMAHYRGRTEKPEFTYEPVDVSLIPPRKRDYTSKSKGGKK